MNQRTFFNLSAITNRIQEILQPYSGKLFWVKAEISSGRERGGSFYCDLVETNENGEIIAQMRCTIWSRDLVSIRKKFKDHDLDLILDNGTVVGLQCSIQYNPRYGLSLKAIDADPVASHDLWSSHFMFSETHTSFSHLEKIIERKTSQLSLSHLACSGPHSLRPPRHIPQLLTFSI